MAKRTTEDPHAEQPVMQAGSSLDDATTAAIVLHGRGASAESILRMAQPASADGLAMLAPQARGHTWYPQSFLAPLPANQPALDSALSFVGRIREHIEDAGIPTERIVLMGFSQGACLASEFAARNANRYGGLIAFSGGLIGTSDIAGDPPKNKAFEYEGDLDGTPAFLGCSDRDPHIPQERVDETARQLRKLGADVDLRIYEGMGHTVNEDELQAAAEIIRACV